MFCALALLLCAAPSGQAQPRPDPIIDIAKGRADMATAIRKARAELPRFFKRFAAPDPSESYFLVKYDLVPGEIDEFIWAQVVTHTDGVTTARLVNNPRAPGYRRGQEVRIPDAAVIDWSYVKNERVEGAATTRALLNMVSPGEAAALRKSHGWD
ncbi:DUF2314 domain-containing protein [Sphingomonas sp. LT1P40]|uniref:DUF2314 domain-containing protein n=1 Tax=Alteristakelama amylovorans TaxID=3096166 RepID=UPI002FCB9DA9